MKIRLLADVHFDRHLDRLLDCFHEETWHELWEAIGVGVVTFEDLDLTRSVEDDVLWNKCQREQVVLCTANRNADGPQSLQRTIEEFNEEHCLPVFCVANAQRLLTSRAYARRVSERLLEYLFDLDQYRGVGRIWLP